MHLSAKCFREQTVASFLLMILVLNVQTIVVKAFPHAFFHILQAALLCLIIPSRKPSLFQAFVRFHQVIDGRFHQGLKEVVLRFHGCLMGAE